jgi:hypothetical protein
MRLVLLLTIRRMAWTIPEKGEFDDTRYQSFKTNYEAITVANVSANKVAREKGRGTPVVESLNRVFIFNCLNLFLYT